MTRLSKICFFPLTISIQILICCSYLEQKVTWSIPQKKNMLWMKKWPTIPANNPNQISITWESERNMIYKKTEVALHPQTFRSNLPKDFLVQPVLQADLLHHLHPSQIFWKHRCKSCPQHKHKVFAAGFLKEWIWPRSISSFKNWIN